eukprot:87604-Pleurochrysis_carterae.AAC.3
MGRCSLNARHANHPEAKVDAQSAHMRYRTEQSQTRIEASQSVRVQYLVCSHWEAQGKEEWFAQRLRRNLLLASGTVRGACSRIAGS